MNWMTEQVAKYEIRLQLLLRSISKICVHFKSDLIDKTRPIFNDWHPLDDKNVQ